MGCSTDSPTGSRGERVSPLERGPQMQLCPPPPAPPRHNNMFMPNGCPNWNNGCSDIGHQAPGGEMWHGNRGQPQTVNFSQYHGGRFNGGGTLVEEVEEECFYESKAQEMHYEHNNWGGHNGGMGHNAGMGHNPGMGHNAGIGHDAGMGHRPSHARMGMSGFPKVSWVAKGL